MPFVCRGRLQKGRFFVFHSADSQSIRFLPSKCAQTGADIVVNEEAQLRAVGPHLQVELKLSSDDLPLLI